MPTPPAFGDADFSEATLRLAPRGPIWRRDGGSLFRTTMGALAPTYTRSTEAGAQVLVDASPATTRNLLNEWEASLGLPDPCTRSSPTLDQRRAAVRAKFGARGSLTPAYFVALGAALGLTITIKEFRPFKAGQPCGRPLYGPAWAFAWQVNAPQITIHRFKAGGSSAGDPLATFDNTELACRIMRDAPAGTTVFFVYS
jgi:uncharacterized protein YmfQ (DUF2313 family)